MLLHLMGRQSKIFLVFADCWYIASVQKDM